MGVITLDQLKEQISQIVKEEITPLLEAERKTVPTAGDATDKKIEAMEKMAQIIQAMAAKDYVTVKALTEGTDSEGGYLVPEEFRAEVIRLAGEYGIARRYCRVVPMTRDVMKFPTVESGVTASWVDEGGTIGTSQPTFGQVTLTARKLAAITVMTNELLADANVDVVRLLQQLFAEALAQAEDDALFNGSAGGNIPGILNNANVTTVTMSAGNTSFADVTADDLADMIDQIPTNAARNARFYLHRNILTYLRKLKDNNGQYIWQPPASGQPGTIWGYPYELSEVMPDNSDDGAGKPFIVFGDLRYVLFGDRQQVSIKISTEGTVGNVKLFETDQQAIRFIERIDIQLAVPSALVVLKTATS